MENKLSDYLHLYLGCEVMAGTHRCKLIGIEDGAIVMHPIQYRHVILFSNIKPLLRPLSSMTEEELKESSTRMETSWPSLPMLSRERESDGHKWRQWYYIWNDKEVIFANMGNDNNGFALYNSNDYYRCYVKLIPYLLSKHFDLFGLIESGLALDSTKSSSPTIGSTT